MLADRHRSNRADHRQPVAQCGRNDRSPAVEPGRLAAERNASDGKRAVDFAAAAGRWNIVALLDPDYSVPASVR